MITTPHPISPLRGETYGSGHPSRLGGGVWCGGV